MTFNRKKKKKFVFENRGGFLDNFRMVQKLTTMDPCPFWTYDTQEQLFVILRMHLGYETNRIFGSVYL